MAHLSDIKPGAIFTHYKNKNYEVIDLATDEATLDRVVVYRTLYGAFDVWVRKVESFCGSVELEGKTVERFALKKSA
jgi:hypothetical protein